MTATVEFSNDARRMLDDADERWVPSKIRQLDPSEGRSDRG
jgi:hypothetical protein